MLTPNFDQMPVELTAVPRWVNWRYQDTKKLPISPATGRSASVTKPTTWNTFERAKSRYEAGGLDGLGIVLVNDGLVGIDIDHCVTNGQPDPAALELLHDVGAGYVEVSPSGEGLRAFGYSDPLPHGRRGDIDGLSVEAYSGGRYLTVTGRVIPAFQGGVTHIRGFSELAHKIANDAHYPLDSTVSTISTISTVSTISTLSALSTPSGIQLEYPAYVIPAKIGQRHKKLLPLACWHKSIEPDATDKRQMEVVRHWFESFKENIGTDDFSLTAGEYLATFKRADPELASRAIRTVLANLPDLPAWIDPDENSAKANELLRLCYGLQLQAGDEPFFLSCNKAEEVIPDLPSRTASRYLAAFAAMGYLTVAEKGTKTKATRYRFNTPTQP